jgi:hypothetical protein
MAVEIIVGCNYPGFKNEEVDRLLEEARLEFARHKG